jgi:hypothetical protein
MSASGSPVAASPDSFDCKTAVEDYPAGRTSPSGDRLILFTRHGLYYAACPGCGEYEYRKAFVKVGRWVHVRTGFARCGS